MNNKKNIQKGIKLAIAYRIYPCISKMPPVYSDDKYKLAELCLKSFSKALEGIDYRMWVILDNCPPDYYELFHNYFGLSEIFFLINNKIKNVGEILSYINI